MSRFHGSTRRLAVASLGAAAILFAPVAALGASAAPNAPQAAAAGSGWARFGHFAPSAAAVDVYVDGVPFATNISFKTVSEYESLPAGVHTFQIKPAGQPDAASVLDVQAGIPDGGAVTVSAVTTRDGVASQVYDDALSSPAEGQSLVRFIHAAPDVDAVDVQVVGGPMLASAVPYPAATGYESIAAGQYDVDVLAAGTQTVLLHISGWSVAAGAQASIVIIRGLDGKLDVAPLSDAAAASLAPVGGVQTDAGDLHALLPSSSNGPTVALLALLVVGFASIGTTVVVRRRRATVDS